MGNFFIFGVKWIFIGLCGEEGVVIVLCDFVLKVYDEGLVWGE